MKRLLFRKGVIFSNLSKISTEYSDIFQEYTELASKEFNVSFFTCLAKTPGTLENNMDNKTISWQPSHRLIFDKFPEDFPRNKFTENENLYTSSVVNYFMLKQIDNIVPQSYINNIHKKFVPVDFKVDKVEISMSQTFETVDRKIKFLGSRVEAKGYLTKDFINFLRDDDSINLYDFIQYKFNPEYPDLRVLS